VDRDVHAARDGGLRSVVAAVKVRIERERGRSAARGVLDALAQASPRGGGEVGRAFRGAAAVARALVEGAAAGAAAVAKAAFAAVRRRAEVAARWQVVQAGLGLDPEAFACSQQNSVAESS
jgi:hypothetical protein